MKLLYDINVHGSYFCAREVAKHMISKKNGGSIIMVASMSGSVSRIYEYLSGLCAKVNLLPSGRQRASASSSVQCFQSRYEISLFDLQHT